MSGRSEFQETEVAAVHERGHLTWAQRVEGRAIKVWLFDEAQTFATTQGHRCAKLVIEQRLQPRVRLSQDPEELKRVHTLGKFAELATSLALGLPLPTCDTFTTLPDVEPFNVRATQSSKGELIIRTHDSRMWPYMLCFAKREEVTLIGWCWPNDVCFDNRLRDPGNRGKAYFIPQHLLRPAWEKPKARLVNEARGDYGNEEGRTGEPGWMSEQVEGRRAGVYSGRA